MHGSIEDGKAERTLWRAFGSTRRTRVAECVTYFVALTVFLGPALAQLFVYAGQHDLHSHIPLIPIVAGYLLWNRKELRTIPWQRSPLGAALFAVVGVAALGPAVWQVSLSVNDQLALQTLAYLSFVI